MIFFSFSVLYRLNFLMPSAVYPQLLILVGIVMPSSHLHIFLFAFIRCPKHTRSAENGR